MSSFEQILKGYRLTTAEILYRMPDHPQLLQSYVWQDMDISPRFPVLSNFLDVGRREHREWAAAQFADALARLPAVQRTAALALQRHDGDLEILNDGHLEDAGRQLLQRLVPRMP